MKSIAIFPFNRTRRKSGFTLVEILVAVVVLGLLILTLAQIFGLMNKAYFYVSGKVNNFAKARAMLNVLQTDFQSAVFRADLAAFPTSTTVEFYTRRPGVPTASTTNLRNISLIKYSIVTGTVNSLPTSTLERFDLPINWSDSATFLAFGNSSGFSSSASGATSGTLTARDTAPGVIAFQLLFVQSDGSFSKTTFTPSRAPSGISNINPTRAIGITLAVVDDRAMRLLSASQISTLQTNLTGAATGNQSVQADWQNYFNTSFNWSSYPKGLGSDIGIYECYVSVQ